jgi:hypothetical protein
MAALCVATCVLAAEHADDQAAAVAEERRRRLSELHHVAWEDIPRWRPATSAEPAAVERSCRLRRLVVAEVAGLLRSVFPGAQWLGMTCTESVSGVMGTIDSSAVTLYIKATHLNAGWTDACGGSKDDSYLARELIPSIHEAVSREWEDLQVAGIHEEGRQLETQAERRDEPLWPRGFPPLDGAALYPTLALTNHSCDANLEYGWEVAPCRGSNRSTPGPFSFRAREVPAEDRTAAPLVPSPSVRVRSLARIEPQHPWSLLLPCAHQPRSPITRSRRRRARCGLRRCGTLRAVRS